MEKPLAAYKGDGPYVFVSYSHADEDVVFAEIRWLQEQGLNVWYDTTGIGPGSEWNDEIARAIKGADHFLYFITPRSVASEHCRRELNFAQAEGRRVVVSHLEPTDVPDGLRLSLDNRQAILKHRLSPSEYQSALTRSLSPGAAALPAARVQAGASGSPRWLLGASVAIAVVFVLVGVWWYTQQASYQESPPEQPDKAFNLLDRSLAVLPLTVVGGDPVAASLAQTLTEELRAKVAGYQELRLVAVLGESDSPEPATSYMLRGNVQRLGENLRLRVSLTRSDERDTVWAQTFEHPVASGASVAPELAGVVGRILRKQIVVDQQCEPVRRTTRIQEAAEAYCAAVAESHGGAVGGKFDYSLALSHALRAVALDPDIADAHVFVGLNSVWVGEGDQMDWREATRKARESLDRSLALAPNNPRAFGLKGRIEMLEMDYPAAEASLRESIARDPLLPRAGPTYGRLAILAFAQGRLDEALANGRRALRIDDSNAMQYSVLSSALASNGEHREAIQAADAGLDLVDSGPSRVWLYIVKVRAHNALGERSRANEVLDEALASAGSEWRPMLGGTLAYLGRTEEARKLLAALERLKRPPTALMVETYAQLGDDRAFDWIHSAIDRHDFSVIWQLRANPAYSPLRNDLRWAEVMSHLEAEEAKGSAGQNRQR